MSKEDSFDKLANGIVDNIKHEIARNPTFMVKYWGESACHDYLKLHYPKQLLGVYRNAQRGVFGVSFREDICKMAVLCREGGFSMDMDVQLAWPLLDLIGSSTSFMGVRHSNMLIAATPNHTILQNSVANILPWYESFDSGAFSGVLGPTTLDQGFQIACGCGMNCDRENWRFNCGGIQLYVEVKVACNIPSPACPENRFNSIQQMQRKGQSAHHLRYGIFSQDGQFVAGWSRFYWCGAYGCGADYKDKDWIDINEDKVEMNNFLNYRGLPSQV